MSGPVPADSGGEGTLSAAAAAVPAGEHTDHVHVAVEVKPLTGWRLKFKQYWKVIVGVGGLVLIVVNNLLPIQEVGGKQWVDTVVAFIAGGLLLMQQKVGEVERVIETDLDDDGVIGE